MRKVVYKPGNLGVDKQLFGSQQGSLARALDDQGTAISNYTILTRQDAAHHNEHYGYMKFVESGAPTNQAELLSVYQSLAANMAVSFLAGLEDIHHENVLLLRDRVQVIDMEATTGMFSKKQNQQGALDPGRGGFLAMQWNGALRGIKDKLLEAANSGALQSAPASGAAQAAMVTKFGQILGAAQQGGFDQSWQAQTQALGQLQSRLVPIATTDFYGLIPRAKAKATQQAWDQEVDDPNGALLNLVRGSTGHTDAFLKRVLKSPGTYHALFRGEVPYYVRDLGGAQVFDEEGNPFSSAGCSKVGQAMGTEMDSRRQELQQNGNHADVFAIFQAQIVPIVGPMNDAILQWIQAFAQRQNQGGGQQP